MLLWLLTHLCVNQCHSSKCYWKCDIQCLGGTLQWRHDERYGVSNHKRLGCLLNRLIRRRSKKTSKLRVTGLCEGNSPVTGEFPAQRASNAENVFICWRLHVWWRHHEILVTSAASYWCACIICADMAYGVMNTAASLGTDVEFTCVRPENDLIIWNVYPMSRRPDNPDAWRESNLAVGGILYASHEKYGLSLLGKQERLQIRQITYEDAAVIECVGVNAFQKRAQLVVLGEFHTMCIIAMMTSSNGNISRVTNPLCGEFTRQRWIPRSKACDAELWCFLWSAPE